VTKVYHIENNEIVLKVNLDSRLVKQSIQMPCLLCVDGDINTPRLPSYKTKLATDDRVVTLLTLNDFDDQDEKKYGSSGSPTQVERIFPPEKNTSKEMFDGDESAMADKLFSLLKNRKLI
jgi:electron transfer flavoprotein beta subunit